MLSALPANCRSLTSFGMTIHKLITSHLQPAHYLLNSFIIFTKSLNK